MRRTPSDEFIDRFLSRLPGDLAASFTGGQLAAIRHAFGLRYESPRLLDVRRRLGPFYVVLLAGRDGR